MKIDIYSNKALYCIGFNEKEYTFIEGNVDMIYRTAYKWLNKQHDMWKPAPDSKELADVLAAYRLVATIYVTAVKDIPAALEAYPELLL